MTHHISVRVYGTPAAQGSKRHLGNGVMVESSKKVKPWRADVVNATRGLLDHMPDWTPLTGPVAVHIRFYFSRPKSHYGTGKNADVLKPSAPVWVTSRAAGDADKLIRSTQDALVTAGAIADDSLIAHLWATKTYVDGARLPGAEIHIEELTT